MDIRFGQESKVIELVRDSFLARVLNEVNIKAQRLDFFTRFVEKIPIRRLNYPAGLNNLGRVRETILSDIRMVNY